MAGGLYLTLEHFLAIDSNSNSTMTGAYQRNNKQFCMTVRGAQAVMHVRQTYIDGSGRIYVSNTAMSSEGNASGIDYEIDGTYTVLLPYEGGADATQEFPSPDDVIVLADYYNRHVRAGTYIVTRTFIRSISNRLRACTKGVRIERIDK